jgi:uncharacterized damage-inducible protein DinB
MTQERQETRAEEVARVRGYLASQSMRRTPEQLVAALREAHQQLLAASAAIPDDHFHTTPGEGEWSAADVLAHVRRIATFEGRTIGSVIVYGEQPPNVDDTLEHSPKEITRERILADIAARREQLIAVVLQADPQAHLDILWGHNEFGQMNWREWLLFARVHTLDHARQLQAIAAALSPSTQE